MKKALVSQFQQDLSKADSTTIQGMNQVQSSKSGEPLPVFKVEETSVLGKCETVYTISRLPEYLIREFEEKEGKEESSRLCSGKEYYEILKTKNLDRCTERPVYHESYGTWSKTDGTESSSLPSQSSVTKTIICGSLENHIIRKVETENRILSSASGRYESEEKLDITSVSILDLESIESIRQEIPSPSSPKECPTLVYEYPSGSLYSSKTLKHEQIQQFNSGLIKGQSKNSFAPFPDMTSAPQHLYPRSESQRELKQKVVEAFTEIIESSEKMSESSVNEKDAAGLSVVAIRGLSQLSYEELKEVKQTIKSQHGEGKYKSMIQKAFFDLVSIAGTNPCMKLIIDEVKSGEMNEEPATWSWILSNSLRSVKTPTEELLEELVELLKHQHIQQNRIIRAAYAMGLTELINKACINPESQMNEFPTKIYGEFCHPEMSVIKENLIPFLSRKLRESSRSEMGSVITYVNALGNLGTEQASKELMEVVEGRISVNPHPRSVAVYKLIRPARENPSVYRPVFLSLIENSAESSEVRMAAITALTYCYPSTADLQKLAVRSWFEPSEQVSTYIYSTLKTLSQLPSSVSEFDDLKSKAEITLPLCKPSFEGIQNSRSLQVVHFIESLRTAVSQKLQWTSSEESFYPRSIFTSTQVMGLASNADTLETSFYMQGAEYVLDKLYEMYSDFKNQGKGPQPEVVKNKSVIKEKMSKLNIKEEEQETPEAHLTLKMLGLQKLYSFDEEYVREIVNRITAELPKYQAELEKGMDFEHMKLMDLVGSEYAFPTESGMPVYLSSRTPVVFYSKSEVKSAWESNSMPKMEMKIKGVLNYKRQLTGGVISPITEKFYGAGVETSMHVSAPLSAQVSYRNGQVQVSIEKSEEPEHQREQPWIQYEVQPFTTEYQLSENVPMQKSRSTKTIESRELVREGELNLEKYTGMDMTLKMRTQEPSVDFLKLWEVLKVNIPLSMGSPHIPILSCRRSSFSLLVNPRSSEVQSIDFFVSLDAATKTEESTVVKMTGFSSNNEEEQIKQICDEFAPKNEFSKCKEELEEKIENPDRDVEEECEEKKTYKQYQVKQLQQQQQQCHQQVQQVQQQYQQLQQVQQQQQQQQQQIGNKRQCMVERQLCKEEKKMCMEKMEEKSKSTTEARKICQVVYEKCESEQITKTTVREVLYKLEKGSAVSVSMGAILRGQEQSEDKKIQAHVVIGHKTEERRTEETQVSMKMTVHAPILRRPFTSEVHANGKVQRPVNQWNIEDLLKEDVTSKVLVHGDYGFVGEKKEKIQATIIAYRSDKQVEFVKGTVEYERCSNDESEGRKLTRDCKETRYHAASLDKVSAKLSLPRSVADSRITEMATEAVKLWYMPYLTQRSIEKRSSGQEEEYEIEAKVDGRGHGLTIRVSGNGEEVEAKNIRLTSSTKGLLPICTQENLITRVFQKMTSFNSPSSCAIEGGKVQTFDRLEYNYNLNDCEQILFTESSSRPRITVSSMETPKKQEIIMVVDGHKYEVEIQKLSRHSRDNKAIVKVNGQEKQLSNIYDDEETYISKSADGVYSIISRKYGVSVKSDGKSIEVESYQHFLRNKVTGLCGDLNGEKTADLKSSKGCIMSEPRLAAFSFMLEDGKCRGIPQQEKSELKKEEQRCVRKEVIPTKVSKIFRYELESKKTPELKHLIEETKGQTCFSKELIRVCGSSYPKELKSKLVEFVCTSGSRTEILKRRVLSGELVEELNKIPTCFQQTVYEPKHC
eukprot:TRINITY_DN79_c0_g1_i2.p1 TRINITY_DN79_c0_g1~~TRINITY_DN79_c0_g1_i2.p1  ORF type:complete len:1872 (+),score=653.85 TRINITY_DN79_c0_g1_i2:417-5618(+)